MVKKERTTINPKNNDDTCFQYAVTVASNYQNIKCNPERISKIKPFIDQYIWKKINFTLHKEDWKMNQTINQLLLISCMCLTMLHINQSIT